MATFKERLDQIYNTNLNRDSAATGQDYWQNHFNNLTAMGQTEEQAYANITASVQKSNEYQTLNQPRTAPLSPPGTPAATSTLTLSSSPATNTATTTVNPVSAADHTGPWETRWQADKREGSPWNWRPEEEQKQWRNVTGAGDIYDGVDLSHFNSYIHKAFSENLNREPGDEGYAYWSKDMAHQQSKFMEQGLSEKDAQDRSYQLMVANIRQSPEYDSILTEGANRNPYVYEQQPGDTGQQAPIYYGSGGGNTTVVTGEGPKAQTAADLMINPYKDDPNIWAAKNRQGQLTSKQAGSVSGVPGSVAGSSGGLNIAGPR